MLRTFYVFLSLLILCTVQAYGQDTTHTEGKKVRYLKRLEKKNERFVSLFLLQHSRHSSKSPDCF